MDVALHYTESGAGEPLILLHGNGEDSTYFEHQLPFLAQWFRVIAVDTRGHGRSPRGEAPFTLGQFTQDLGAFMDELGLASAHLLGFSDGANVALLFALANPQRVRSLVLDGANLFPEGLEPAVRAEDAESCRQALASGDTHQLELLRLMMDEPHIDPAALAALRIPALVTAGTHDMIQESHTRLIAASIPGARLSILAGTHFHAHENPDPFNQVVGEFYRA